MWIGKGRKARRVYGFDDVSLSPSALTIDIEDVDIHWKIQNMEFDIPIIAAAMDAVVDTNFAIRMSQMGSFGTLNLEGLYTRYENPKDQIQKILNAPLNEVTSVIQEIYNSPIKDELVYSCIKKIKDQNALVAVSSTPLYAYRFAKIAKELSVDLFLIQSTVTSPEYYSTKNEALNFKEFFKFMHCPVIVGNCVTYKSAIQLMEFGAAAILVGIGPGAACTTRQVLGIGIPQITATVDVSAARDVFYKKTGKYVSVITDGGISSGGDIAKAIAAGADAVMLGSLLSISDEAPAKGYHWGMAASSQLLPRGTRVYIGKPVPLEKILFGPSWKSDGSYNLVGAIKMAMASCGAKNIREMQLAELAIAPSIKNEGKFHQDIQNLKNI